MSRPATRRARRALRWTTALLAMVGAFASALVWQLNRLDESPLDEVPDRAVATSAQAVARGAYLARAGNCQGCHSAPGGAAYAGGVGVPTPFGMVYAPNLTPDASTGLGRWTDAQFFRALHNGRSRDGRLLYPAFPYPNYTRITRSDASDLLAYLRSLPAVAQPDRAHDLRFPFDRQVTLAVWRALYFRPARTPNDPTRSADWNRGAYLVEGLGHCNACHARRNALGATRDTLDLAGGLIPVQNWYAPALTSVDEAAMSDWDTASIAALLRDGISARGAVSGPMSDVVSGSTQHLSAQDLRAMAVYLHDLPTQPGVASAPARSPTEDAPVPAAGATIYSDRCAACHGERGEGISGIYPALAGSRAVTMATPANLVHIVQEGGFPPATQGNPRPFGMPTFATVMSDLEVAQVLSWIRHQWGNRAAAVSELDVRRYGTAR